MTILNFSEAERAAGRPHAESIQLAKTALETDGFVVLEDVVDLAHIAVLREKMLADLPTVLARTDTPFNFNRSNVQQDPPPFPPYLFRDVLVNEFVIPISEAVLGKYPVNAFYSSNVALPNTFQRQPVHADIGHLWSNTEHATPAYALVINIPLVDMSAANGSTEIWPGTQADTSVGMQDGDITASEEKLAYWRAKHPPIQPVVKAGSILMRDIRMWHAGMPNPSPEPRPMIAMIHWVGWWRHDEPMPFSPDSAPYLEHSALRTHAKFVNGPIDYLGTHGAYALSDDE